MLTYKFFILIFLFLMILCFFYLYKRKHDSSGEKQVKSVEDEQVKSYLRKNFSDYQILEELSPNNINKTFCMQKDSQKFILKITCKDIKRAHREAALLEELGPQINTPKLISSSATSIPGHILMSHCGAQITSTTSEKNFFNYGAVVASISSAFVSDQTKKILKKNRTKYIKKLRAQVDCSHPYAQFFMESKHLPRNYLCHGDMHLEQAMVLDEGKVSIIDWESAALSYRVVDLSRALTHCIKQGLSVDLANAVLHGYKTEASLDDEREIKLLLSLIWYELNKIHIYWAASDSQPKEADFISKLITDKSLENIFDLKYSS